MRNKIESEIRLELVKQVPDSIATGIKAQRDVLFAEIQGESRLQHSWRRYPLIVLSSLE